ncbi:hypothetical protein [Paraburkholderia saeva]|uniref:Uncharacterized protein n=1 Tax=Paraburkholderia saeva TaxID=2777537 RepID=A0A9N8RZ36_9BURK|nr:hypothetical protein [Paraburkholderia saeva]CAG4906289.1 hypothetical protein LMG31841_03543 [Paraburkholderia saeva]
MKSIPDVNGEARRAYLREMQDGFTPLQSDFEQSPVWRITLLVAVFVIGINVFAPAPVAVSPASAHATV